MKIIDCFTFFNEFDLLEIRLNELKDVVDKFVICESKHTFSGNEKPLYYDENKERFSKFENKIIHLICDYNYENAWMNEYSQRNHLKYSFDDFQKDDIIMLSDCDEIPNKNILKLLDIKDDVIYNLVQQMYFYFLNVKCTNIPWCGTQMFKVSTFLNSGNELDEIRKDHKATPISKLCKFRKEKIESGGWHFSYVGGKDKIYTKINSFAHYDYLKNTPLNTNTIEEKINSFQWLWNDGQKVDLQKVEIDSTFPNYLKENLESYKHLIKG